MLRAENILSSLCYFSVFFSPFLFPIIIYILATGETSYHVGRSLWTHLVIYLAILIFFIILPLNFDNQIVILIIFNIFFVIIYYYFILYFIVVYIVLLSCILYLY